MSIRDACLAITLSGIFVGSLAVSHSPLVECFQVPTPDAHVVKVGNSTGFVYKDGIVVTAAHVLDDKIKGIKHPTLDVAVVFMDTKGKRPVQISKRKPLFGDPIYTVGWQLNRVLVRTDGRVGEHNLPDKDSKGLLICTTPMTPGSSGSPVFSQSGRVVGIATRLGITRTMAWDQMFLPHHGYFQPIAEVTTWLAQVKR